MPQPRGKRKVLLPDTLLRKQLFDLLLDLRSIHEAVLVHALAKTTSAHQPEPTSVIRRAGPQIAPERPQQGPMQFI